MNPLSSFLVLWLLVLVVVITVVVADELSIDDIRKLKIAELKNRLKLKGLTCNGCAEKDDYVNLYMNNQNLPDVIVAPVDTETTSESSSDSSSSDSSSNSETDRNMAAEEV